MKKQKIMPLDNEVFNFWKDNRVDGFFQLNSNQLIERFNLWLTSKERSWLEYYSISDIVPEFIGDKINGLCAVGNSEKSFSEYRTMEIILKPILRSHLQQEISQL